MSLTQSPQLDRGRHDVSDTLYDTQTDRAEIGQYSGP